MTRSKLTTRIFFIITCLGFGQAYAYGTTTCPSISSIQCIPVDSTRVLYFSKSEPGDWKGFNGPEKGPCSLGIPSFVSGNVLSPWLVACQYKYPDNSIVELWSQLFTGYRIHEGKCNVLNNWSDPAQQIDYSVSCDASTQGT